MFKRILVPTDASEYSRRALEMALELARSFQAEVILLHVSYTPQAYWGYTISYGITVTQEQLEQNGELAIEATLVGMDSTSVVLHKKVESGHPVTIILEEMKKENIDLIVMAKPWLWTNFRFGPRKRKPTSLAKSELSCADH